MLHSLGVRWALAPALLRHLPTTASPATAPSMEATPPPVRLLRNVLPPRLLDHLAAAFAPASPYWTHHRYHEPATPFFSYLAPIHDGRARCSVEQALRMVHTALQHTAGLENTWMRGVTHAEWWLHARAHEAGHQLHFDANEALFNAGQQAYELHHPAASSILFLDATCGGPTLITDQVWSFFRLERHHWSKWGWLWVFPPPV